MIEVIPATKEHVDKLVPNMRTATMRAIAAVDNGEVVAVGGVYRTGGDYAGFLHVTDEVRKRPKLMFSQAKKFLGKIPGNILATCDPEIKQAESFLRHLGFKYIGGGKWQLYR